MIRTASLRPALALLALAVAAWLAFGCSKQLTVDPGRTPEGVLAADSKLIVFQDIGNLVYAKHEFPPNSGIFLLDSTFTVYNFSPGTVQGQIMDGTLASGFELLRQQSGGGFSPIKDFPVTAAVKLLSSHWAIYPFNDQPNDGSLPPTYQARGALSGSITTNSPLTNQAVLAASAVADCKITEPFLSTAHGDSLPLVQWNAVPGAANYYLQIYQYRGDIKVGSEKYVYGIPAPVAIGKVKNFFIGILPGTTTSYKLGQPGAEILINRPMIGPDHFFFRVSAVDANGRLIACSAGAKQDTVRIGTEAFLYSPGAEIICVSCGGP